MASRIPARIVTAALAGLVALGAPAFGNELKVSGSATVAGGIVNKNKAAIEQDTGLTISVTVNGDGNGLKDLYSGKSDVAMVAAPIKLTEEVLNKAAPGSLDVAGFEVTPVGNDSLHFIVHPTNPVKTLSEGQLKDIFTGKITSWKDVGGDDKPILVVSVALGLGQRSNLVANLLGGVDVTEKARSMQGLVQVVQVVAQAPNAIGYATGATLTNAVVVIPGVEVKQVLGLVTKGAPSPEAKKFIAAAAKFGAAHN
jgi:phosphate transport system substrate-binding protein